MKHCYFNNKKKKKCIYEEIYAFQNLSKKFPPSFLQIYKRKKSEIMFFLLFYIKTMWYAKLKLVKIEKEN